MALVEEGGRSPKAIAPIPYTFESVVTDVDLCAYALATKS